LYCGVKISDTAHRQWMVVAVARTDAFSLLRSAAIALGKLFHNAGL